ncbi:MAG: hypothetical protein ACRES9_05775, partial [Gammaproteobacteria bacterium]
MVLPSYRLQAARMRPSHGEGAGMDKLLGLLVVMMCASLTGCAGFVARNIEQPGHIRTAPQMR